MKTYAVFRWAALLVAVGAIGSASSAAGNPKVGEELQRSFLWLKSAPEGEQVYVAFRKRLDLAEVPKVAVLHLFADSRYTLWINGQYVDRGPCRFDPLAPEYDSLDVRPYLQRGANAIAVLVHHFHDGQHSTDWVSINGRIMRHAPGLTARLDLEPAGGQATRLTTDSTWRGSTRTRFLPSPTDRWENTWSSLADRIDARRDPGDWTQPQFDDSSWEQPVSVNGSLWGALSPRGTPRLRESEVGHITLLNHSRVDPGAQAPRWISTTPQPLAAALPLTLQARDQLIFDAGEFAQAYSVIDFAANDGSELELEYAQGYFDTGHTPSGSYGHVNRYVARAGRQSYMSGDTFGFKYLVVRLKSGQATLHGVRLVNRLYPFDVAGSFRCNDALLNQLWSNCVQTIRVCSEDAYVDCATRERVEWMADGYAVAYRATQVALAGPGPNGQPVFGDPRLLRNLLRHIGQSRQPDGRLKAHHPSDRWDIHGYIEDYSCLWVQALREYYDHTGDPELARELWPALTAQLQWFLDRRTTNGLVKAREFVYPGSNPLCYQLGEGTTLNAYLVRALRDAAYLADKLDRRPQGQDYATAAEGLAAAVNRYLWDDRAGTYRGGLMKDGLYAPTVPAAFIALCFDLAPAARRARVQAWLLAHHQEHGGLPYSYQFLFEALYGINTRETDSLVLNLIRQKWAAMVKGETHTVWEGFGPGENCHEAGAVPAYFLSAYVLGVRLEGPASNHRLRIEPRLGDLSQAEGVVVTELGLVPVRWRCETPGASLEFEVEIPQATRATVALPLPKENSVLVLDDQLVSRPQIQGRYVVAEVGPGLHRGKLSGR